jgi:hypothetical protein
MPVNWTFRKVVQEPKRPQCDLTAVVGSGQIAANRCRSLDVAWVRQAALCIREHVCYWSAVVMTCICSHETSITTYIVPRPYMVEDGNHLLAILCHPAGRASRQGPLAPRVARSSQQKLGTRNPRGRLCTIAATLRCCDRHLLEKGHTREVCHRRRPRRLRLRRCSLLTRGCSCSSSSGGTAAALCWRPT